MNWHDSVFALIDLRSFSNVWFWIMLALLWSNLVHAIIGVPHDMVLRARRRGGQALEDLVAQAEVQARRRVSLMGRGGVWLVALVSAGVSAVAVLGFVYRIEFAQAVTLLLVPLVLVLALNQRLAARIDRAMPAPDQLMRDLTWHRVIVQAIGLAAILVTSVWGMLSNLSLTVLGR